MMTTFALTALFGSIHFVISVNSEVGIFNQNNYNQIVGKKSVSEQGWSKKKFTFKLFS